MVFMGTPAFAVPTLEALADAGHDILCVVTQPDRPAGRGHKLAPPPVKVAAQARGLRVLQPERVRAAVFVQAMRDLAPDVAVVAAFGQKITAELLAVPAHGFVNVHPSLLPRYRGAAPVERCLLNGDSVTGVTIMYMDEGWDTGDIGICREFAVPRDARANAGWLEESLARVGAELMVQFLRLLEEGRAPRTAQDHSMASYAPKISRDELEIDWRRRASQLFDTVRGLAPDPGARTTLDGQQLRVLCLRELGKGEAEGDSEVGPAVKPGTIMLGPSDAVIVACGENGRERVTLEEVQPSGKRCMTGAEFARGRRICTGARLGS
ncbi:MAG TPA: methionyl-tRNA formyltransferase [Bacillota bacterium]|nr:methionyl-tRNA formyltransferase [Bacillota bacterium]